MAASSLVRLVPGMLCSLSPGAHGLPIEIRRPGGGCEYFAKRRQRFLTSRRLAPRVFDSATHVQPAPGSAGCSASPHAPRATRARPTSAPATRAATRTGTPTSATARRAGTCGGRCTPATTAPTTSPTGSCVAACRPTRPWSGTGMAYNWGRAKPRHHRRDADGRGRRLVATQRPRSRIERSRRLRREGALPDQDRDLRGQLERGLPLAPDHASRARGWPTGFIHFDDRRVGARSRPEVGGRPAVGQGLVATTGRWSVSSRHTFQWLADGKRIRGATSARFTPGPWLQGRRLSVRVTASDADTSPARAPPSGPPGWRADACRPWRGRRSRGPSGSASCCRCVVPPGRRGRTRRRSGGTPATRRSPASGAPACGSPRPTAASGSRCG